MQVVAPSPARSDRRRLALLPRWMTAEHPLPWLLPATALTLAFGIYPLCYSIWLSFHRQNFFTRRLEFIGLHGWINVLHDGRMWHSLWVTTLYTVVCLIVQLVLGLAI